MNGYKKLSDTVKTVSLEEVNGEVRVTGVSGSCRAGDLQRPLAAACRANGVDYLEW